MWTASSFHLGSYTLFEVTLQNDLLTLLRLGHPVLGCSPLRMSYSLHLNSWFSLTHQTARKIILTLELLTPPTRPHPRMDTFFILLEYWHLASDPLSLGITTYSTWFWIPMLVFASSLLFGCFPNSELTPFRSFTLMPSSLSSDSDTPSWGDTLCGHLLTLLGLSYAFWVTVGTPVAAGRHDCFAVFYLFVFSIPI